MNVFLGARKGLLHKFIVIFTFPRLSLVVEDIFYHPSRENAKQFPGDEKNGQDVPERTVEARASTARLVPAVRG
jgi:hypothetical protein